MQTIDPRDASVLSLLAQHPGLPARDRKSLTSDLGKQAKLVAKALTKRRPKKKSRMKKAKKDSVRRTAVALRQWADANHRIAYASSRTRVPKSSNASKFVDF